LNSLSFAEKQDVQRRSGITAIRGFVAPTEGRDAVGIHSLDQFVLQVPDANEAIDFYGNFGVDVLRNGNTGSIPFRSRTRCGNNPSNRFGRRTDKAPLSLLLDLHALVGKIDRYFQRAFVHAPFL
jgi:hypothetical protein